MTTTAPATADGQGSPDTADVRDAGHVDVLVVGAGVSGIGAAHHLQERFPDRRFVVLEAQDARGGTWWTNRFPGIRSDSDLFTYGYRFKPWRGPSIAAGQAILDYLDEVIAEDGLEQHIRYHHRVTAAAWSTDEHRWTVHVTRSDTGERLRFTTDFLWMCQGYYDHEKPHQPRWPGWTGSAGWSCTRSSGRRTSTTPGSGSSSSVGLHRLDAGAGARGDRGARDDGAALAVLLLRPADHPRAGRGAGAARPAAGVDPRDPAPPVPDAVPLAVDDRADRTRRAARVPHRGDPAAAARGHRRREALHPAVPPVAAAHRHRPRRRLLRGAARGAGVVVTDTVEEFTETGIRTGSGEELEADIVVTATGFDLAAFGGIPFTVDGEAVDFAERITWRG
jgi:cation diffusion facilitator CzcD-associated flavoprotein CzcO